MKMFLLIAFEVLTFTAFRFDLAYGSKGLPAYCRAVDQLSIEVRDCLSNRELVAATELCEKGFAQKLEFSRQSLNKSFELRLKKQRFGQLGHLDDESGDLNEAHNTLTNLIGEARAVREEQRKYLEIISFPGGLSRSAARASGMEAMMHRFPCFAGTDSAVRESIIKLDKQIQELERSDQEALTLDGKNDRGMKKLGSMKASNPEAYVRADSKSLSVTGSDASSSSDITGYLNVRRKFSSVSEKTEKIAESDGGKLQHAETIDSEEKRDSNLNLEPSLPHEQKIANSTKSGSEKTTDPGARNSVAQIAVSAAIETSNRLERESTKKANEQSFSRSFGDAVGEETIKVSGNSPEHELGGGISDSEKSIFQITNRVHQKFAREQAR